MENKRRLDMEEREDQLYSIVSDWGGSLRAKHVGEFRIEDILERGYSLIYQIRSIDSMDTDHRYKVASRTAREAYSLECALRNYDIEADAGIYSMLFKGHALSRYFLDCLSNLELKENNKKGVRGNANVINIGR